MTKQRLDRARVGAILQQVSGKAVTQSVRRNVADARFRRVTLDHGPGELSRQWFAAIQKQVRVCGLAVTSFNGGVLLQPVNRALADGNAALLASFAMTNNHPELISTSVCFNATQFRHAQPGRIHHFQHRSISNALFCRNVGRGKQLDRFLLQSETAAGKKTLRRVEIFGGMMLDVAVEHQEAKKTARRADGSGH